MGFIKERRRTRPFFTMFGLKVALLTVITLHFIFESVEGTPIRVKNPLNHQIHDHELVDLSHIHESHLAARRSRRSNQRAEIRASFTALGETFDLHLIQSDDMLTKDAHIEFHRYGRIERLPIDASVIYRGTVNGLSSRESDVRLIFTDGVPHGSIFLKQETYFLENATKYYGHHTKHSNIVYPASALNLTLDGDRICGLEPEHETPPAAEHKAFYHGADLAGNGFGLGSASLPARSRRAVVTSNNYCEMALVADHHFFAGQGHSSTATTSNSLIAHLEYANRIYRFTDFDGAGSGYQVAIKQIKIYEALNSSGNPFQLIGGSVSSSSSDYLNQLSSLEWASVCLAHSFTEIDFDSGVLGLAWVGTICRLPSGGKSLNTGITTNRNEGSYSPSAQTMLVVAHEIGHNYGMSHDTSCSSYCSSNPSLCDSGGSSVTGGTFGHFIMWPTSVDGSQPNNDQFSGCSTSSAGAKILSTSGAGGFCFTSTGGQICGNGIVQGDEECDCGTTDDPELCFKNDPCCTVSCTLNVTAQCSPLAGACCDDQCQLTGYLITDVIPANATLHLCREATDCTDAGYCIQDPAYEGDCPHVDFPYHNLTAYDSAPDTPAACSINVDQGCIQYLPQNPSPGYKFHKPDGTLCNSNTNVCKYNGCTGSVCALYNSTDVAGSLPSGSYNLSSFTPLECQLTSGSRQCDLACEFQSGVCNSTKLYANTTHGASMNVIGLSRAAGRACNNYQGYCTSDGQCLTQSSDSPLTALFNVNISAWVVSHWYVVVGMAVGLVALAFLLRATYKKKDLRIKVKKRMGNLRKSVVQTLRFDSHKNVMDTDKAAKAGKGDKRKASALMLQPRHHRAGTRARQIKQISLELEDKRRKSALTGIHMGEPDEALNRMEGLFPTAKHRVLRTVIRCSPHEEAAVGRMLMLGYPILLTNDYKVLAHANKRAKARKQASEIAFVDPTKAKPRSNIPQQGKVVANNNNNRGNNAQPPRKGGVTQPKAPPLRASVSQPQPKPVQVRSAPPQQSRPPQPQQAKPTSANPGRPQQGGRK